MAHPSIEAEPPGSVCTTCSATGLLGVSVMLTLTWLGLGFVTLPLTVAAANEAATAGFKNSCKTIVIEPSALIVTKSTCMGISISLASLYLLYQI